ncbi:hypothetical protein K457DRAFT_143585 [Linnemannia elongata AG-77]|uniref:DUF6589 domain-containing protein n=1 Tax=Linnemannia elongata AG-77 TaxID=1314771 RepID=A0A197JC71_9FUNG|nr:hypothetical protein K457DRAFT_143585 [Linnemannia elongata AG-77]
MARRMWQTKQESSTQHSETSSNDIFLSEINNLVDRILLVPEYIYDSYSTINGNALIFIRDMVVYLEFCSAIKDGDVGRIEEILKRITIMLQSGKHSHYALELLRLRFHIQHRWSENRKNAIFSSLLMNTKGLPHRWIPSDMYQEFNNLLTKKTHATVGFKSSTMSYITPLIRLFHVVHRKMLMEYKLTEQSTYHRDVSPEGDISIIMNSLKEDNILGSENCPAAHRDVDRVVDVMALGWERLSHGGYENFLKRILEDEADLRADGGSDRESDSGDNGSSDDQSIDSSSSIIKGAAQQLKGLGTDNAQSAKYLSRYFQ